MFPRVTSVKYLHDFVLELTFSDGSRGQVNLRERIEKANPAGVFAPLRDPAYFAQIELWAEAGTDPLAQRGRPLPGRALQ